jgi:asparagine synthase (glutamine-hydrolysing)
MRYIIMVGPSELRSGFEGRCEHDTGLRLITTTTRFSVFVGEGTDAIVDSKNSTAILGYLFSTVQPRRERELDDNLSQGIALSEGQILTDRYWGQYIAAYNSGDDDGVCIQRDPLEMAPCYYFHVDGLWLIVSDIAAPRRFGLLPGRLDWSAVGELLFRPDLRTERTCFLGICEMPGGCRLKITGKNTAVERLWRPSRFVAAAEGFDSRAILDRLRRTAQNCIHAWASCYDRMLVQISGGLDSSILAATLARRGEALTAVTLATSQPEGDERAYSRRVAEHLAIPLLELAYDPSRVDVRAAGSPHLPRPTARSHVQETPQCR